MRSAQKRHPSVRTPSFFRTKESIPTAGDGQSGWRSTTNDPRLCCLNFHFDSLARSRNKGGKRLIRVFAAHVQENVALAGLVNAIDSVRYRCGFANVFCRVGSRVCELWAARARPGVESSCRLAATVLVGLHPVMT